MRDQPEDLSKVLEPFFTTKPHGSGLGLSICRAILWEIGGTMNIESQPGLGTRVALHCRWRRGSLRRAFMSESRILVVDDEPGMLRAVERVLGDTHHVLGTRSSKDAVSLAAEFVPELAIVDIRMPEVDGFELMSRLKSRLPHLDIILMTGSVDDLDEKLVRAIRSPAFYFIQKPFDREVLKTLVERCLELRWRREAHRRHLEQLETECRGPGVSAEPAARMRSPFNRLSVCCRYIPCSGVGGDLYDYGRRIT